MCRDLRIRLRVPHLKIDAVCNSDQAVRSLPHEPLKPVSVLRRLDFVSIAAGNRRERVRYFEPGLKCRCVTIESKSVASKLASEAQFPQFARIEPALIGHVMNGKDCS